MIKIVQCWDDGIVDDIRLCEMLRGFGARASFNLNAGLHGAQRGEAWRYKNLKDVQRLALGELRDVYEGFTIANHTLTHPWLSKITPDQLRCEVTDGRRRLQDLFGEEVAGFAYPFGEHPPQAVEAVREARHVYARTCGNRHPAFPAAGDPMKLESDCHFKDPRFWEYYEEAKAAGSPAFYFWGHSYEMVTEGDWEEFAAKLARFDGDTDADWTDLPDLFPRCKS